MINNYENIKIQNDNYQKSFLNPLTYKDLKQIKYINNSDEK
jgi:hypothetical protein